MAHVLTLGLLAALLSSAAVAGPNDADQALAESQAALGRGLPDIALRDERGAEVRMADFQGRPLLISMIFTSCHHVCPAITQHLEQSVDAARDALGEDSFQVLTIGFDTPRDTPQAMGSFRRAQGIDDPEWHFLSISAEDLEALTGALGFTFTPSPRGFDHINQLSVIDRQGRVYRQVYGAAFELPWMVEPLKDLVFDLPRTAGVPVFGSLVDRIRLFCTVYDPSSGHYRFDYSLFIQMAIGAIAVLGVALWLVLEARRRRSEGV